MYQTKIRILSRALTVGALSLSLPGPSLGTAVSAQTTSIAPSPSFNSLESAVLDLDTGEVELLGRTISGPAETIPYRQVLSEALANPAPPNLAVVIIDPWSMGGSW